MTDLSEIKKLASYRPKHKVRFVTAASLFDGHDASGLRDGFGGTSEGDGWRGRSGAHNEQHYDPHRYENAGEEPLPHPGIAEHGVSTRLSDTVASGFSRKVTPECEQHGACHEPRRIQTMTMRRSASIFVRRASVESPVFRAFSAMPEDDAQRVARWIDQCGKVGGSWRVAAVDCVLVRLLQPNPRHLHRGERYQ